MRLPIISGLLGHPVVHTLSPSIHNYLYEQRKVPGRYAVFDILPEYLPAFLRNLKLSDKRGINVTLPYKQAVIPYIDELSDTAAACGAVNVILNRSGSLYGDNTDVTGFVRALHKHKIIIGGQRVLLLGAGGAARAVMAALMSLRPAAIQVMARRECQAADLVADFQANTDTPLLFCVWNKQHEFRYMSVADIIINATPVGMWPHVEVYPGLLPPVFRTGQIVIDLIYNPLKTKWLTWAEQHNCTTMNGLDMLLEQACLSFEKINQIALERAVFPPTYYWEQKVQVY